MPRSASTVAALLSIAAVLAAAGCDDGKPRRLQQNSGSTTPAYQRVENEESPVKAMVEPVRIGEMGSSFAACTARGTTRRTVAAGDTLAVRAAPFDSAKVTDQLPPTATFFVCARSLDQQWFGVVFDAAGTAAPECGVLAPAPVRRDYAGPCRSGWVASAFVKLTAD